MKKVLVIGCPGAGKSVFSRRLADLTALEVVHLDNLFWNEDRTKVPKEEFLRRLNVELDKDCWIVDGNYSATMELRFSKCDTVFFFDLPTEICLEGIKCRIGVARPDLPWIESGVDYEFENFVRRYNSDSRPSVERLIEKFTSINVIRFNSREQADAFLEGIKK